MPPLIILVLVLNALKSSTRYNTIIFVSGSLEPTPLLWWDLVGSGRMPVGTVKSNGVDSEE